jgi:hypothetical protein
VQIDGLIDPERLERLDLSLAPNAGGRRGRT